MVYSVETVADFLLHHYRAMILDVTTQLSGFDCWWEYLTSRMKPPVTIYQLAIGGAARPSIDHWLVCCRNVTATVCSLHSSLLPEQTPHHCRVSSRWLCLERALPPTESLDEGWCRWVNDSSNVFLGGGRASWLPTVQRTPNKSSTPLRPRFCNVTHHTSIQPQYLFHFWHPDPIYYHV